MKDEMRGWLERAQEEYAERKRAAEANVVRWEWFTASDREMEPFYFERHKFSRGKRLPAEPAVINEGYVAYGLDAHDRVAVERRYAGIVRDDARWFYEAFYEYSNDHVEWVHYDYAPDKEPVAVHRATFSGERMVSLTMRGRAGGSAERYQYDGTKIVRIEREVLQEHPRPEYQAWSDWFEVHWDELGRLARITQWDPHTSRLHTIFERRAKGETLKELVAAIEIRLVEQIPACVAALDLKEPAYTLVLAYDGEGNDMLPPVLGVGLARERDAWMAGGAQEAQQFLWNPAEYGFYDSGPLVLADQRLRTLCDKANQEIALKDKWSVGRGLLDRVAAALRAVAWGSVVPVTDDFVVYAVDFELGNLRKALRAAASKELFERWRRDGLVP